MILSNKYKDFIFTKSTLDVLEGTTYAGKTTVGFGVKFLVECKLAKHNVHLIAGESLGTVEKNIINTDNGLLDLYSDMEYHRNGSSKISLPHLKIDNELIYIVGFTDVSKFKKVLGSQFGAVGIDEANIAHDDFINEVLLPRFEYCMMTANPDNPSKHIYARVFDRARAIEKYREQIPTQMKNMQSEQIPVDGWNYWYFTYDDNPILTQEKRKQLLSSVAPNTIQYKTKIQGLRAKAEGLIYDMNNVLAVDKAENIYIIDISIDSGYMQSATAVTAYGRSLDGHIYVLDTYYFKPTSNRQKAPSVQAKDVHSFYRSIVDKYKRPIDRWIIDSAEGALRTQLRSDYGITARPVAKAQKKTMIEDAFDVLFSGVVRVVKTNNNIRYWLNEHENYAWDDKKVNEPIKENDHTVDNFQYYVRANRANIPVVKGDKS